MPLLLELTERPLGDEEIAFVGDLDEVLEVAMCSCSSSDANPYS
ncbi:hypothetical protein [Streptacidiphilus sp. EB103A]|jgi:hypothetical protein